MLLAILPHQQSAACITAQKEARTCSCNPRGAGAGLPAGAISVCRPHEKQPGEAACGLWQAATLAAVHLLRPCASSGSASRRGIPLGRSGRRAPAGSPGPAPWLRTRSAQRTRGTRGTRHTRSTKSTRSNHRSSDQHHPDTLANQYLAPTKKPRRFAPAGLFDADLDAYFLAASFFSFSLAITVSATLFGQAE